MEKVKECCLTPEKPENDPGKPEKDDPGKTVNHIDRRIIIVCDSAYTNVPQRLFWSVPPTYAAGYSDGSVGPISVSEFARFDRSCFAGFSELYPPESR